MLRSTTFLAVGAAILFASTACSGGDKGPVSIASVQLTKDDGQGGDGDVVGTLLGAGILGLGVAEPMPSWGSLLKELEGLVSLGEEPWKFVPLILLVVVMTSFQLVLSRQEEVSA